MNPGFNIIEYNKNYLDEMFDKKMGIIEFLRLLREEETLPFEFAVTGLDVLLYYSDKPDKIARYISDLLRDRANFLTRKQYIIQIIVKGKLEVIETNERPWLHYMDKKFLLHDIFGRVKQVRVKHFIAPLNLQS